MASALASQDLVVEELACAARRWTASGRRQESASAAVAVAAVDTSVAVGSLAVAAGTDRAAAVLVDTGRDRAAGEVDRMHHTAVRPAVGSAHGRWCARERKPGSEQILE